MDSVYAERMLAAETTDQFLWIVIVGGIGAFFAAFGIGANDVANAFATSVGAKSLTIKQAVVLAGVFEFLGAVLLGSHVTKTIRKGIAEVDCFKTNPGILMYGMQSVVWSTGLWLLLASTLELPVSTTHSTVGGIVGMALVYGGTDCVVWHEDSDTFPYVKGISAIVVSWFLSPVMSAVLASILFLTVRTLVLRSDNSYKRSFIAFPILVACTICVNVFFIVYKGAKGLDLDETPLSEAFAWAFGLGFGIGLLLIPCLLPRIKAAIAEKYNEDGTLKPNKEMYKEETKENAAEAAEGGSAFGKVGAFVSKQVNTDPHSVVKESEYVSGIHDNAEKFEPRTEDVFKYVQVFTAICDSFSHGANDVANAMGPFAAIYSVYEAGVVDSKQDLGDDAFWILALGGVGIVVGLALYGYKIISAIGVKIAKITPSRGFAIELGSAMVVIIGSRLEIPLSTTHCQVGATVGVASLEGKGGINMVVLGKAIFGWVITLVVCGCSAALLFAQGAYAPYAYAPTFTQTEVDAMEE